MAEDGGKAIRFLPGMAVKVAEDDDAVFAALWVAVFITFDFGDSHGWEGFAGNGAQAEILGFSNDFPSLKIY